MFLSGLMSTSWVEPPDVLIVRKVTPPSVKVALLSRALPGTVLVGLYYVGTSRLSIYLDCAPLLEAV